MTILCKNARTVLWKETQKPGGRRLKQSENNNIRIGRNRSRNRGRIGLYQARRHESRSSATEKPATSTSGTTKLENSQRPVQEVTTITPARKECEDDNYTSRYGDGMHFDPPKGPFAQNNPAVFHGPASSHPNCSREG